METSTRNFGDKSDALNTSNFIQRLLSSKCSNISLKLKLTLVISIIVFTIIVANTLPFIHNAFQIVSGLCIKNNTCTEIYKCGSSPTGGDNGCIIVNTHRKEWKDPILKSKYKVISEDEAKKCALDFINDHKKNFLVSDFSKAFTDPWFIKGPDEFDRTLFEDYYVFPLDVEDIRMWTVYNYNGIDLDVGAQTCTVYPSKYNYKI